MGQECIPHPSGISGFCLARSVINTQKNIFCRINSPISFSFSSFPPFCCNFPAQINNQMSAFLRRRMRGLLRTTFSAPNSTDAVSSIGGAAVEQGDEADEEEEEEMLLLRAGPSSASATVYQRILNGKSGGRRRRGAAPEVYSGKTGLDLPTIHIGPCSREVKACHTGPDGGLTKVQPMRQRAIAKMVKLDDEEFSLSSMDEDEPMSPPNSKRRPNKGHGKRPRAPGALSDSIEALAEEGAGITGTSSLGRYDWNGWDEQRAYGLSTSLYERHPVTGLSAGHPIADVFGIIVRENNAILALADGVNWGEGARLAARCAIRGALDHLNAALERDIFATTNDIFHSLLGAFHAAHALILQEGGALTTLCVALVAPVRASGASVLCACNVGDSLCFVYNAANGVREVTLASHDIAQMRDMRDAGGALGPVDGRNPQLHNLTCSMTFVEDGDLVFITSDGISDNFDPVVGKFCVIKRPRGDSGSEKENKEAEAPVATKQPPQFFHKTKSAPPASNNGLVFPASLRPMAKRPAAMLPCVDALERHELMLLRMSDVIPNGLGNNNRHFAGGDQSPADDQTPVGSSSPSSDDQPPRRLISAADLCRNLILFAYQLSVAKRRTLEDPELYRTRTHSKTEERLRRKVIRDMIMEMPGKLDHASVVAYRVGRWPQADEDGETPPGPLLRRTEGAEGTMMELDGVFMPGGTQIGDEQDQQRRAKDMHRTRSEFPANDDHIPPYYELSNGKPNLSSTNSTCSTVKCGEEEERSSQQQVEKQPQGIMQRSIIGQAQQNGKKRNPRHHQRGAQARHTLGVDVSWLKRLVTSKHEQQNGNGNGTVPMGPNAHSDKQNGNFEGLNTTISSNVAALSSSALNNGASNGEKCGASSGPNNNNNNFSLRKLRVFMRQQPPPSSAETPPPAAISCQNTPRDDLIINTHNFDHHHHPLLPSKPPSGNGQQQQVPRMGLGQLQLINGTKSCGVPPMATDDDEEGTLL